MPINSFNPDGVWRPFGPFSQAVVQGQGKIVHLKGQVSLNKNGEIVGKDDIEVQVAQVLENIQSLLSGLGGRMEDIYSLTHYVTNIKDFMTTGSIRTKYFKSPYPVTTTVEVRALYHPDLLLEITGSAEIPLNRFSEPERR